MKPQLLKVSKGLAQSFSVRRDVVLYFYNRWHYHPELELLYIEQGSGTQFVGDSIQHFNSGDVLLIGPNLPHYWRCDEKYFQDNENLYAQATVIHFLGDIWGSTFLSLPENQAIAELIQRAKHGIRFLESAREKGRELIQSLLHQTSGNRLITLYQILDMLAQTNDYELLSTTFQTPQLDDDDTDRINRIYSYSLTHFQQKISIENVAEVANISPNSFCRYFKSRSRKTYSRFLLELRVGHACKLLREHNLSIAQVCFESGFHTFSNFNKYFKYFTGKSPIQYQREYQD
ncbi:AraC family transcriptional regulator [Runella slithyformis]|uniref:Transcriptional regulator, AraC family n=1 Tax=Runella slithyformis (strain ATCC 29530 / DSM 19594 / LMG 11500 / NCIMB 11436 / LSU 4) TaxID=761193 RepID=A0A7U3ZM10_RUNSL|nr:AraC family transcriptional regulator [Runella slithyformis]AEI49700.1 transcriptional regulator, AraC family [Runella slithyformis DSM 19594]